MKIRIGYELIYDCPQPTPMILTLNVHYTRVSDLIIPDHLFAEPPVHLTAYRDSFGNWCSRIVAPQGQLRLSTDALVRDSGQPDPVVPRARQTSVDELPDETLLFLLGSRYCETDLLSQTAWNSSANRPLGGIASRPSAISSIDISPSVTSMPAPPRRPVRRSRSGPASAAISRTSPSRFVPL